MELLSSFAGSAIPPSIDDVNVCWASCGEIRNGDSDNVVDALWNKEERVEY